VVTNCGRQTRRRGGSFCGSADAAQRVGIKEVDDGIWLVSFMHYDLGYIDLQQRTLQPIDTPFG